MRRNIKLFQNAKVKIDSFSVQCSSHTCFFSSICQIWLADQKETRKLTGRFEMESLNLELCSGMIYSFLSENPDFLLRAYKLFIAQKNNYEEATELDFERGTIGDEDGSLTEINIANAAPNPPLNMLLEVNQKPDKDVLNELEILIDFFKNKPEADSRIIPLLNDILAGIEQNKAGSKNELFHTFIHLALIQDCNVLGLGKLITYVIKSVYQP